VAASFIIHRFNNPTATLGFSRCLTAGFSGAPSKDISNIAMMRALHPSADNGNGTPLQTGQNL
jgi:hypothetical protein